MSTDISTEEKVSIKVREPKRWKVIIINDEYTPIDFVIAMLIEIFINITPLSYW